MRDDELRERLWKVADRYIGQDMSYTVVNLVLAEIGKTHVLIAREWLDRQPVSLVMIGGELVLVPDDLVALPKDGEESAGHSTSE